VRGHADQLFSRHRSPRHDGASTDDDSGLHCDVVDDYGAESEQAVRTNG
jgi:hypothetical protein